MRRSESHRRARAVGGFRTNDTTLDFYERVRSVCPPGAQIVDFGAGRGEWLDGPQTRDQQIRDLRDVAGSIVGLDVAPAVLSNPQLDQAFVIDGEKPLPVDDAWADVVVADWVVEHLDDPAWFAGECSRIVKPGGWLCARTPNRSGYIALGARLVPNGSHVTVLRRLQPDRKAEDVFPTHYRLNTVEAISGAFGDDDWENLTFPVWPNMSYGGGSILLDRAELLWRAVAPDRLAPVLNVFLRRR